jgi:MSHA biogenesis protein MshQ
MDINRATKRVLRGLLLMATLSAAGLAQATTITFNGADVAGCTRSGSSYSCPALPYVNYNDSIVIASGASVTVTSAVSIGYSQGLTMSGTAALTANGNLDIGGINPAVLSITGGSLSANGGTFSMGAQAQTITANISAANINLGTGSTTKVTGSLTATGTVALASYSTVVGPIVAASVSSNSPVTITGNVSVTNGFQLASGSSMTGNVSAGTVSIDSSGITLTGNVTASTSLSVGSSDTVTGNVVAPTVTLAASSAQIKGNVTASTSLTIASGDSIGGDVSAGNVVLQDSNAFIAGNASVTAITLGYADRVQKTITCKPPGSGCSCVTNNSGYTMNGSAPGPVCAVAPPATPPAQTLDHIQITQPGSALTCQPQNVTVTACANQACTVPYTGGASGTLSPGGGSFSIPASSSSGSGTVSQTSVGPATLNSSVANTTCVNTGNSASGASCTMNFDNKGFALTFPNQTSISETAQSVTIAALAATAPNQSCVPLFKSSQPVTFTCSYVNPGTNSVSGNVPVRLAAGSGTSYTALAGNAQSACTSAGQSIQVPFDALGQATLSMLYADAGMISLAASYALNSKDSVVGSANQVVAPAGLSFTRVWAPSSGKDNPAAADASGNMFIGAGQTFSATLAAVNTIGGVTTNFGNETGSKPGLTVSENLIAPSGGSNPSLVGSFASFVNGVATASNLSWSEVGIIALKAQLSTSTYLGSSTANPALGNAFSSANIGRFVPDHFQTVVTARAPMDCSLLAALSTNCGSLTGFVYANQTFPLSITALNATGSALNNYQGTFAHPVTLSAWSATGGSQPNPPASQPGSVIAPNVAASAFGSTGAKATPAYRFALAGTPTAQVILPPTTTVFMRAIDTDGVTSQLTSGSQEGGLLVVSGRIQMPNNYGSELLPMTVNLQSQYWSGSAWLSNPADNVSSFLASDVTRSNCQKQLSSGNGACLGLATANTGTANATTPLLFSNGRAAFRLSAPGAGNVGSVDLQMVAPVSATLPGSYPPSTKAREVFGIYKSGPVLYQRELY